MWCALLWAQTPQKPAYQIAGISVEGNRSSDSRSIITSSGLYVGEGISLPDENVQNAIRRLSERDLFSQVNIVVDNVIGNQLYLVIRVKEFPRLEEYKITGNKEEGESDIKKKITLTKGDVVTDATIFDARRDILALYTDEGYLHAQVNTRVVPSDS
ncbi:MAG TPA: POTRA domain-containing protein, partial [Candidatus Kapabacteria bacterium]|nr:POTRA domain-containing protein [Candidatus Kapabacteria bacterium]